MKPIRALIYCSLLLASGFASAQDEAAIRSIDNLQLSGAEDPATSKVYIVQLRSPSAAEYYATQIVAAQGKQATAAGKALPRLQKNSAAIQAYAGQLEAEQRKVIDSIGPGTDTLYSYKYGLNGFAARMSVAQAQQLRGMEEVVNVWEDEIRPLVTNQSRGFLGLFDNPGGLRSEHALDGEGVIIGVIDKYSRSMVVPPV